MMDTTGQMMLDMAGSAALQAKPKMPMNGTPEKIREAAVQFEAVFATQMLQPMFEEISTDGLFGGGQGENVFRSLLVQEFGEIIAERGGFGIADSVARELLKAQEAQSAPGAPEPKTEGQPS